MFTTKTSRACGGSPCQAFSLQRASVDRCWADATEQSPAAADPSMPPLCLVTPEHSRFPNHGAGITEFPEMAKVAPKSQSITFSSRKLSENHPWIPVLWHRSLPNISWSLCCPALGHNARQWCLKNKGAGESWQHIQQLPWSRAAWRTWAQQLLSQKHCRILLLENVSDTKR